MRYHFLLVMLINLILVVLLVYKVWTGNDKAPILFLFVYPLLMLANLSVWAILKLMRRPTSIVYLTAVKLLLLLLLPTIFVFSLF